jgi:hypothetical protein
MGLMVIIVLAVYIILSIGLAIGAHYIGKRQGWKWCRWWTVGLVMFLIPTWDIIPGRYHFHGLCEKDAGLYIYETAQVDGFYFKDGGSGQAMEFLSKGFEYLEATADINKLARYYLNDHGELEKTHINKPTSKFVVLKERYDSLGFNSKKFEHRIEEVETGKVLSVYRRYGYYGGWVEEIIGGEVQGVAWYCPPTQEDLRKFYSSVLIPMDSSQD